MDHIVLKAFLEEKVLKYNCPEFIHSDPVCIPHQFTKQQDIEISGLIASVFAWGQRKTIINKSNDFIDRLDKDPHNFILHHSEDDLKRFLSFKHRTFNATDALCFIQFLRWYYERNDSLEKAFIADDTTVESGLIRFFNLFFSLEDVPKRTKKHVSNPARNSACKRLNMYLRWMVRKDDRGVDFGIWKTLQPSQLICPCDLHVTRVARKLGLIKRKPADWKTAMELTHSLKRLDSMDPVKYDFALFGLGIQEKF